MTELLVLSCADDLTKIADAWNRLRKEQRSFFPDFESLVSLLSDGDYDFRIFASKDDDQITSLACFVYRPAMKPFKIGERKLFTLAIKEVCLFGSAILGGIDNATFDQFLDIVEKTFDFNLISFGYIPVEICAAPCDSHEKSALLRDQSFSQAVCQVVDRSSWHVR